MNVSDAYLVAINSDVEQTTFNAQFGFVPPGAREGLKLSSSEFGQLWGNRLIQLNNGELGMGALWNTLELNRSVLGNGGEYLASNDTRQTGDWSKSQSTSSGEFIFPPHMEMTLDKAYDLIGVQIIFDDIGIEWATEIKIGYYDSDYVLLEERIFSNDRASMSVDWSYNGIKYIKITINNWNIPNRFAKISQIIPGQIRYFTDDMMYSFLLRESISPFSALTIPENTLIFSNENQEYNIINPQGLTSKLRELMDISSSIGIATVAGFERISTGNFPLFSWPDSANDETAAFNCRPDLGFSDDVYVGTEFETRTVAATAADISAQARLRTAINVDSSLQNVLVNINIGENVGLQDALGQLAIAAGGYIKFERDGTYTLKPIVYGTPVRTINYDNIWGKPNIQQSTVFSGIRVRYSVYNWWDTNSMVSVDVIIPSGSVTGRIIDVTSSFIATAAEARRIGAIALEFYSHRLTYSFDYRGDMSIEAGDVISVETDYGFRDVLVLEHEISYDTVDYLQGRITGIGIDN